MYSQTSILDRDAHPGNFLNRIDAIETEIQRIQRVLGTFGDDGLTMDDLFPDAVQYSGIYHDGVTWVASTEPTFLEFITREGMIINQSLSSTGDVLAYGVLATPLLFLDASANKVGVNKASSLSARLNLAGLSALEQVVAVYDTAGNARMLWFESGDLELMAVPATAGSQNKDSPVLTWRSRRWTGAASNDDSIGAVLNRNSATSGDGQLVFLNESGAAIMALSAGTYRMVSVGYAFPQDSQRTTLGQLHVNSVDAGMPVITARMAASQTADGLQLQDNGGSVLWRVKADGILRFDATMGNSSKDPTTDAPADWVEIQIGGTTYYLPAYAA